jgi:hypothetical protein
MLNYAAEGEINALCFYALCTAPVHVHVFIFTFIFVVHVHVHFHIHGMADQPWTAFFWLLVTAIVGGGGGCLLGVQY